MESELLGLMSDNLTWTHDDAQGFVSKYITSPWSTRSYTTRLLTAKQADVAILMIEKGCLVANLSSSVFEP